MGIVSRIGRWLDTRFPQKISAEEVYKSLAAYAQTDMKTIVLQEEVNKIWKKLEAFERGAQSFDRSLSEVKDDLNKVKGVQAVMNRTRVAPIMPSGEPWKR